MLVAALGALLLLWPMEKHPKSEAPAEDAAPAYSGVDLEKTEKAMEAILGKINGVGEVDVMLTLHSGSERVLAQDRDARPPRRTGKPQPIRFVPYICLGFLLYDSRPLPWCWL